METCQTTADAWPLIWAITFACFFVSLLGWRRAIKGWRIATVGWLEAAAGWQRATLNWFWLIMQMQRR